MPTIEISEKSGKILDSLAQEQMLDSSALLDRFIQGWCAMSLVLLGQVAGEPMQPVLPLPRQCKVFTIRVGKPGSDERTELKSETVSGLLVQFVEHLDPKKIYACLMNHDLENEKEALVQVAEPFVQPFDMITVGSNNNFRMTGGCWYVPVLNLESSLTRMREVCELMKIHFEYEVTLA